MKYATVNITSGNIIYLPNEDNSTVWPGIITNNNCVIVI